MVHQAAGRLATAFILSIVFSVPQAHAAGKKPPALTPEMKAQIVANSVKVVGQYLNQAKRTVSNYNGTLVSINKRRQDFETKESKIREQSYTAEKEHEKNDVSLRQALSDDYKTQTTALIVPRITQLHQTFLNFVDRYRAQGGLVPGSAEYIEGDTLKATRPAMAEIVRSQDRDLDRVKQIVNNLSRFVEDIGRELETLGNNPKDSIARFGFDHYYTRLLQRIESRRTLARTASVMFNGLTSENVAQRPTYRCSNVVTYSVNTFNQNLDYAKAQIGSDYQPWVDLINDRVLAKFYNGDSTTPGWISSWRGCSENKKQNVENYRKDIEREISRNNIELAKQLDFARGDLEFEIAIIDSEIEVLQHHASQFSSILNAAAIQGTIVNRTAYPNAWKKTITAQVNNLESENSFYPALFQATDLLLGRALDEIKTLPAITDPQNRSAEMRLVAEKLASIRSAGFSRLIEQLDSVNDQLSTMSRSIGGGEVFLEETINNYARSTNAKVTFWKAEQDRLPQTLSISAAAVTQARDNFNKSLELKKLTINVLAEYAENRQKLYKNLDLLQQKFGGQQFNPLYSELASQLLNAIVVKRSADYSKVREDLKAAVTSFLASFKGVKPIPLVKLVAAKKGKAAGGSLVSALQKARKELAKDLSGQIDKASSGYLDGYVLSGLISESARIAKHLDELGI